MLSTIGLVRVVMGGGVHTARVLLHVVRTLACLHRRVIMSHFGTVYRV